MKIAIISDVHGNLSALQSVWPHLNKVDEILCLGDLVGYYSSPNEVIKIIRSNEIITLLGNHEYYLLNADNPNFHISNPLLLKSINQSKKFVSHDSSTWITKLKPQMRLVRAGFNLLLAHGSPWDPLEEYIYPDFKEMDRFKTCNADFILLGHTHRPMVKDIGDTLVINPGSVGQPRDNDTRASFATLDLDKRTAQIHRVPYDKEVTAKSARLNNVPEALIKALY